MNATSEDIVSMLEAESVLGLVFKTNLFIGKEPSKPPATVTVFDTPGFPPQLALTDQGVEYPSVQLRIRDVDYMTGWQKAEEIKAVLHGRANEEWGDAFYMAVYCSSGPALLDWDENDRPRFIINFNLIRRTKNG